MAKSLPSLATFMGNSRWVSGIIMGGFIAENAQITGQSSVAQSSSEAQPSLSSPSLILFLKLLHLNRMVGMESLSKWPWASEQARLAGLAIRGNSLSNMH